MALGSNLIVYWPLDEAAGNDRENCLDTGVGDFTEAGGGTVDTAAGNVYATAADWPAAGGESDYLSLANADKGEIATEIGAGVSRTYAFWLYMYDGSTQAGQYKAIWQNGGSQWNGGEFVRINQDDRCWCIWGDGAGAGGHASAACHGPAAVLNSWELWIVQQDADEDEITIFKWPSSGIEEQNETQDWEYGQATNGNAIPMSAPDTNGNATHRLGPFMCWSRILTADEREQLWNDGDGLTCAAMFMQSDTFTTDATVKAAQSDTITADATIKATQSGSFTADAVIKEIAQSSTFTADATIAYTQTGTFTGDATIKAPQTGTLNADSAIKAAQTDSATADAAILRARTGTFTSDSVIQAAQSGSATADAAILAAQTSTVTGDAVILAAQTGTLTSDAIIRTTGTTGTATLDAVVGVARTGTVTLDAVIVGGEGTFTADAVILSAQSGTLTNDAVIQVAGTGTLALDARVYATIKSKAAVVRTTPSLVPSIGRAMKI